MAGKISGIPMADAQEKFYYVANQLAGKGYTVINPITEADYNKTWDDALRGEIKKMLECDEVHMLHDWQESRGAMPERDIALRLGMEVAYH